MPTGDNEISLQLILQGREQVENTLNALMEKFNRLQDSANININLGTYGGYSSAGGYAGGNGSAAGIASASARPAPSPSTGPVSRPMNRPAVGHPGYAGGATGRITSAMRGLRDAEYFREFESGETDLPYQQWGAQVYDPVTGARNWRNFGPTESFEEAYAQTPAGRRDHLDAVRQARAFSSGLSSARAARLSQSDVEDVFDDLEMFPLAGMPLARAQRMAMGAFGGYGASDFDEETGYGVSGLRDRQVWRDFFQSPAGRYAYSAGRGALYGAAEAGSAYFQTRMREIQSDRIDPMGRAGAEGQLGGSLLGALVGGLFGPFGGLIGASAGGQLGSALMEFMTGQQVHDTTLSIAALHQAGLSAGLFGAGLTFSPGYYFGSSTGAQEYYGGLLNPAVAGAERLRHYATKLQNDLRLYYRPAFGSDADLQAYTPTAAEIIKGTDTVYSALLAGGINPEQMQSSNYIQEVRRTIAGWGPGAHGHGAPYGAIEGDYTLAPMEAQLFARLTRNMYARGLVSANGTIDSALAPVLSNLGSLGAGQDAYGANLADLIARFGVQGGYAYKQATTDIGQPLDFNMPQAAGLVYALQFGQRQQALAQTQVRGVGAAMLEATSPMINAVGAMPGGTDSLLYGQLMQQQRANMMRYFRETDIGDYDMPMSVISGMEARRQYLPFMPSYGMGLAVASARLGSRYLGTLESRYTSMMQNGDLSEEQQLAMMQQIEGLKTQNAAAIGRLAWGREDLLPGLAIGRPHFAGAIDSVQLASLSYAHRGVGYMDMGALNGADLMRQQQWMYQSIGMGSLPDYSRSQGLNNRFASGGSDLGETNSILKSIDRWLQKLASGPNQPSRMTNPINPITGQSFPPYGSGNSFGGRGGN